MTASDISFGLACFSLGVSVVSLVVAYLDFRSFRR